ncbi:N-6 DNA methylase [Shouchella lehensis]|uniref:N-6 DNA methylase n=1 Tax=Shouchella lehensis G1 TaxID=1246626 RepID=A0A060LZ29_9BACI|nr:N-6 DNA methylase [Shouchella lehensis]AIC96506.1 N-6 DNA methylase [Shouchella lehensis G1]
MLIHEKNNFKSSEVFSAKEVFKNIRNFLAGRFVGATKDDVLLNELIKLVFCNRYLTKKEDNDILIDPLDLAKVYREIFDKIKIQFPQIFESNEQLLLDPVSIEYVHNELNKLELFNLERDPIGDAYEIFIGENIKGQSGQFFTPKNAADTLVSLVAPKPTDKILDFACGAGGFLISVLKYYQKQNYSDQQIIQSLDNLHGIDKDDYLTNLARIHLATLTDKICKITMADSLVWDKDVLNNYYDQYDVILTNPPYGAKINSGSKETLSKFDLAYKWKKKEGSYLKTDVLNENVPPQVIFIEQAINKVRPGGKIGIVVPESLISSKKYSYVVQYIKEKCGIDLVIGMPEELFKTSGKGGTHTKTALLVLTKKDVKLKEPEYLFLAEAKWCGNDSRGRKIDKDDLPIIIDNYKRFSEVLKIEDYSDLGFSIKKDMVENFILSPRYYNPNVIIQQKKLSNTHNFVKIGDLIDQGIIEFKTGDEVGKAAYGTGLVPFVRTSDISNWEIKSDPKQAISEELYSKFKASQDIREGDILMVKDGTYLIGSSAIITKYDLKMVYQSHLYKIRLKEQNEFLLNPFYLLAILSSEFVQDQIKAKTFTQDIINSLGDRYKDLLIPIQKDKLKIDNISSIVKKSISERIEARELARKARIDVLN